MSAMDLEKEIFDDVEEIDEEILRMTADEISRRTRLLENEIRVLKDESTRLSLDLSSTKEKVKDNKEKIKFNKQLPYLVGNIVEILDANAEDEVRKRKPPDLIQKGVFYCYFFSSPPRSTRKTLTKHPPYTLSLPLTHTNRKKTVPAQIWTRKGRARVSC